MVETSRSEDAARLAVASCPEGAISVVGETWQRALETAGVRGTTVHRGLPVDSEWSRLVCFAGTGAGEVLHGGRKVVGISQRRTRRAARFQCGVHLHWDAEALRSLLVEPRPAPGELDDAVAPVPIGAADLVAALVATLPAFRPPSFAR